MAITNCRMIDFDAVLFEKDKQNTNSSPPHKDRPYSLGKLDWLIIASFSLKGVKKCFRKVNWRHPFSVLPVSWSLQNLKWPIKVVVSGW